MTKLSLGRFILFGLWVKTLVEDDTRKFGRADALDKVVTATTTKRKALLM